MRVLLAFSVLLLLPGAAQARPLCGPSSHARTLASDGRARVYTSAKVTYGCSQGRKPLAIGTHVAKLRLQLRGTYVAALANGSLVLADTRKRTRRLLSSRAAKVGAFIATDGGDVVWIERRGGVRTLMDITDGARDSGRDLVLGFLGVAGDTISYAKGDSVQFAMSHFPRLEDTGASLGQIGDVRLALRRPGSAGGGGLAAQYRGGPWLDIGAPLDDGNHEGGEGQVSGTDALRIAGPWIAARHNDIQLGSLHVGGVVAVDLLGRAAPRALCAGDHVGDFAVSPGGAVSCGAGVVSGPPSLAGEPCGPAAAGTFARSDTRRAYAHDGVVTVCTEGSTHTVRLGDVESTLRVQLAGDFAAVERIDGAADLLALFALRTGDPVGPPVHATRFYDVALSPAGFAAYRDPDASIGDTLDTAYAEAMGASGPLGIAGDVVWSQTLTGEVALQHVAAGRPQDAVLLQRGSVSIALQQDQVVANPGAVPLGDVVQAGIRGSVVVTLDHVGAVTRRDLATGGVMTVPCAKPQPFLSLDDQGDHNCIQ